MVQARMRVRSGVEKQYCLDNACVEKSMCWVENGKLAHGVCSMVIHLYNIVYNAFDKKSVLVKSVDTNHICIFVQCHKVFSCETR